MTDDREEALRARHALEAAMERARKLATHRFDAKARDAIELARDLHDMIMGGLVSRDADLRSTTLAAGQQLDAWEAIAQNADPHVQA